MSDIERLAALLHGIAAGCSEGRTICVTHPNYHKRDAASLIAAGVHLAAPPSDPAAPLREALTEAIEWAESTGCGCTFCWEHRERWRAALQGPTP